MLTGKKILLIISGGIAAYKSLELIRLFKKSGANVKCVVTNGGAQFVTPLSVAALSEEDVYTDLFSLKDETEMGHIRLSREADLIVIAPASANLIAQMAYGLAEDLASTTLLASNRPIMICPAMNPMMWEHKATQENLNTLEKRDGIQIIQPADGLMACGETGTGRMREPEEVLAAVTEHFQKDKPLAGLSAIVTSGPTFEAIDPVRFIGNRSSGKQGHAIASALASAGASVTLVAGPVHVPDPDGVKTTHIESAREMLAECENALPADIAICVAAVSDWRVKDYTDQKIKKGADKSPPTLELVENPDILKTISNHAKRPQLVIGFAAETQNLNDNASAKLKSKNCDWIIANNVAKNDSFANDKNQVTLIAHNERIEFDHADKTIIARDIVTEIIKHFETIEIKQAAE